MEYNEKRIPNLENLDEREMEKNLDTFIKLISKLDSNNIKKSIDENKKILLKEYIYLSQILNIYLKEKEKEKIKSKSKFDKKYILNKVKRIRPDNIIKAYKNFEGMEHMKKYNKSISNKKNLISNYFIIYCFCLFSKIISSKIISSKGDKSSIILIYNLSQHILSFIGKLFLEEIIDINYLELILKILITFAIKNSITSLEEDPIQQNNIDNLIFLKYAITLIKDVFRKILKEQKKFTDEQNKLINDIIIFIQNNIIYSDKKKVKYFNKHLLCKNEYYTIKLFDLYKIIYILIKKK